MLLVATDRALSIWQRVNGLADQYEKIVLNAIAANDVILARWAKPPSSVRRPLACTADSNSSHLTEPLSQCSTLSEVLKLT
jgi:hypothetical protein